MLKDRGTKHIYCSKKGHNLVKILIAITGQSLANYMDAAIIMYAKEKLKGMEEEEAALIRKLIES